MSPDRPASAGPRPNSALLFETGEWNFDTLKRTYDAIEDIAINELKLDPYPVLDVPRDSSRYVATLEVDKVSRAPDAPRKSGQ